MKKEAFFPHQSNFKELIQLIIDHFEKTNRRIDLEKIVEMAQRIWNHGLNIDERRSIDFSSQAKASKTLRDELLFWYDVHDCIEYPNNISLYSMIRRTRLSSEKYKKHMSELYELTLDRWEYESELLQVPKEMKEKILKSMKNPSWDVINQEDVRDFSITMQEIHKHDETFSIASLQNWVRDLQAVMNHTVYEKNGYITSRFTYDLFDKCSMLSGKHYVDVGILLERLLEAHKGVGILYSKLQDEKLYYIEKIEKDAPSIIHHFLDWYIRTIPFVLMKRTGEHILAGAIMILQEFYKEMFPKRCISSKENESIGGFLPSEYSIQRIYLQKKYQRFSYDLFCWKEDFTYFFNGDITLLLPRKIDFEEGEKKFIIWSKKNHNF